MFTSCAMHAGVQLPAQQLAAGWQSQHRGAYHDRWAPVLCRRIACSPSDLSAELTSRLACCPSLCHVVMVSYVIIVFALHHQDHLLCVATSLMLGILWILYGNVRSPQCCDLQGSLGRPDPALPLLGGRRPGPRAFHGRGSSRSSRTQESSKRNRCSRKHQSLLVAFVSALQPRSGTYMGQCNCADAAT